MKLFPLFLLLLLILALPLPAQSGPLIVVLLPGTSLRDWRTANAPHLHLLMATGAIAVMNTRTARLPSDRTRETPESALLTLGAGARAAGGPEAAKSLPVGSTVSGSASTVGELYERRMGQGALVGQEVNTYWPVLLHENAALGYDVQLGNLADTLTLSGVAVVSGGGALSSLLAVSGSGAIIRSPSFALKPAECLIWDAGSDLPSADTILAQAISEVSARHGRLLVLSPCSSDRDYKEGRRLTPVLEWGEGVPIGVLASPSTWRPGLVTDTDFAPTVASYFGRTMVMRPFGSVWTAQPAAHSEQTVTVLEEQAYRQAQGMRILPYLAVALALWLIMGTVLALRGKLPAVWPLVPVALLLAVCFSDRAGLTPVYSLLFLLAAWMRQRRVGPAQAINALLTILTLSLILDMVTGSHLIQRSLLGYSAVEGARYYGIGNEAMGALIGAVLVLVARQWPQARPARLVVLFLLGVVALLLGSPLAGAKAGGLLVSLAAFSTLGFGLWGGRWTPRVILSLLLAVALMMVFVSLGDAFLPGARHSHIGEAVQRIRAGGLTEAVDITWRKLTVESRLAYRSAWACLLWGGLIGVLALWKRAGQAEGAGALRVAGLVAVASCLALNDAGVVAAAWCLVPLWSNAAADFAVKKPLETLGLQRPLLASDKPAITEPE